jgi:hypothetical protein
MDWIFILIAVLIIVGNINKKKQKQAQEEARRRAMQQQAAGQGDQPQSFDMPYTPPSPSMEGRRADPRFPDYTPAPQADPRFPDYTPPQQGHAPAQKQAAPRPAQQQRHTPPQQPRAQQTMGEGMGTTLPRAATTVRSHDTTLQEVMGRRHTLEASSLTGHAHTETGMSGSQEPCPPAAQSVKAPQFTAVKVGPAALMGDRNALAQAIIVSEILGKPKALRR